MCGIAGVFHYDGNPVSAPMVERFTHTLTHRGPDGWGVHVDGPLGLGHRRLAILDPTEAGRCPMPYGRPGRGARYWITFNGEVYNFLELRRELAALGHEFRSETDTEVIAAAYAEWGEDCLLRFNGMWAFAIWDAEARKLFLARDRFGVKPLYYTQDSRFAFASEMKAFLALDGFTPKLNDAIVEIALNSAQVCEGTQEQTLLSGVNKLLPGHCMTVDSRGTQLRRWWNTADHLSAPPLRYEDQVAHWRELFLDAVAIRMRSDVPIGTSLSGGLDSSAVACAMSWCSRQDRSHERESGDWRHAFTASFPGTPLDETHYARLAAEAAGAQMHVTEFGEDVRPEDVIESVWCMEDVYPGIAVPAVLNYRQMRRSGVVVSLDGHGADEMLCGYPSWLDWSIGELNGRLYDQFHRSLLPSILRNYDRTSMACGVEVRMPIMDWRLVCFTFSLPANSKVGAGYTKRIFRDAMEGILPDALRLRRAKIGFNSPMIHWFNSGLGGLVERIVQSDFWRGATSWDAQKAGELLVSRSASRSWKHADWDILLGLWSKMNLVIWQEMFLAGNKTPFIQDPKGDAPARLSPVSQ